MAERICDNCMSRVPADADKCPKCGIRFENTNPGGALPNGWVLNERYTVGRYIDIDGEGVTYSAIDGDTLQRVLLKEFMPVTLCANRDETGSVISKPGCEVLFKTTRIDFRELYISLMRLSNTEGLVQVMDVLEANNTAYAVIERVEGPSLSEYLTKIGGPIEVNRVMAVLRPVLLGVEALHSANIIHRGISPDNIILESGGTAKLGGYGTLALRQQGSELKAKLYPSYSAPEQYTASEFEGRYTDIYALAAVIYRMITGEAPVGADARRMQDTLKPAKTLNKEIPNYLSTGLARAMRVAPAERIQSMSEFRMALSGEGGSGGTGLLGLTQQQLIVGAVALGAIVVLVLVILLISIFGGKKGAEPSSSSMSSMPSSVSSESGVIRVPDFVNKVYADVVRNRDYTSQFTFDAPKEEYSDKVEEGRIISQTPAANTEWDGKAIIQLVVSKGTEKVELPDLRGKTREEATAILQGLKINFQVAEVANTGDVTPGQVTGTQPGAGTQVAINTSQPVVTVSVAKDVALVEMPNLASLDKDTAINRLSGIGVQNIIVVMIPNDGSMKPMTFQSSNVAAFTKIDPRTQEVRLNIADYVSLPNIIGRPNNEVKSQLESLGNVRIGVAMQEANPAVHDRPAGTVIGAEIKRSSGEIVPVGDGLGLTLRDGDTVYLYYAQGPQSTPETSAPAAG